MLQVEASYAARIPQGRLWRFALQCAFYRRVGQRASGRPLELKLGGTIGDESPTEAHNFVLCVAESAVELDGFRI